VPAGVLEAISRIFALVGFSIFLGLAGLGCLADDVFFFAVAIKPQFA
jgi:hypothetical protein